MIEDPQLPQPTVSACRRCGQGWTEPCGFPLLSKFRTSLARVGLPSHPSENPCSRFVATTGLLLGLSDNGETDLALQIRGQR